MTAAAPLLSPEQATFANELAKKTGLDPTVVDAWVHSEEPNKPSNGSLGANNWLNIGITGAAGSFGTNTSAWSDPITAADTTAAWLSGKDVVPGYGTASAGVQSILASAGKSPAQQIAALQASGWAASGYPQLAGAYAAVASPSQLKAFANEIGDDVLKGGNAPAGVEVDTPTVASTLNAATGGITGDISAIGNDLGEIGQAIGWVFTNWLRIFEFLAGVALLGLGLHELTSAATASGT